MALRVLIKSVIENLARVWAFIHASYVRDGFVVKATEVEYSLDIIESARGNRNPADPCASISVNLTPSRGQLKRRDGVGGVKEYEISREAITCSTLSDIDECSIENGGCKEVCENTDGSFFCACDGDEKALSSDGKSCLDIDNVVCPPLNPAGRGYLMCSRMAAPKSWRGRRKIINRPGTKCFLKCPHGYQLHGEYELTCQSDGTWDGPKHGECVRYSKPRLECPKDVVAELPPGRDEAFVTFDQPSTDLDWFRYVRSKPSWGTRLEANLKIGTHEVNFFARHPVSKKQASCVLRIIVKEGEAPKVKDCPNNIDVTGKNGTSITWTEPIFTDNVKVTRISSNESPGRPFDVGGHRIEYEASDEAGWSSKCVFTVVLRAE
ncbi:hypothetical protein V1477_010864 [Vespula maculifrons]|uniref:Uncharacterized protein n=1 Tax=Vespula maculifrons TaxID=7453 RepID=A0ABD2C384_VESMC